MLHQVIVKKDGFYGNYYKDRKHWQKKIKGRKLLSALRASVEVEEGVTFGDIIRAVDSSKSLTAFISIYNNCDAKAHNEFIINTPPNTDTELEWVEVSWSGRVWGKDMDNDLELATDCYGVGKEGTAEDETDPKRREHFAIDLTPSNKLTNLPVKINHSFNVWIGDAEGKSIEIKDHYASVKASHYISFLDFLDALYEEISFFGPPDKDREAILQKLCDTKEEIIQQIEEGKALPYEETEDGKKIYLSDQIRETFDLPSNEEDRDRQIRDSANE